MKERADAKAVARKTFKVVRTGLETILGSAIGIAGLTHGTFKGFTAGAKRNFVSAVTDVFNKGGKTNIVRNQRTSANFVVLDVIIRTNKSFSKYQKYSYINTGSVNC